MQIHYSSDEERLYSNEEESIHTMVIVVADLT